MVRIQGCVCWNSYDWLFHSVMSSVMSSVILDDIIGQLTDLSAVIAVTQVSADHHQIKIKYTYCGTWNSVVDS